MKKAIQSIDRALIALYAIDSPHLAENFLMEPSLKHASGALLIEKTNNEEEINVGIVLHPIIANQLSSYDQWIKRKWSLPQTQALAVGAEEVSHFRYLVFHSTRNRPVSELELEFQAEVDKFLVLYYSQPKTSFDDLYTTLFENYRLENNLEPEKATRYEEANKYAKHFIAQIRKDLANPEKQEDLLKSLRTFYRMTREEKLRQTKR